jgi:hydrogenase maturation protease
MTAPRTVVIGVGHPYRRDDAAGLAVIELLVAWRVGGVELTASSGEPTELIDAWSGADTAIVVDGLRHPEAEPGRVRRLVLDDLAAGAPRLPAATSSHGVELGQTLELARALDRLPRRLVVYAIDIADIAYGEALSEPVAAAAREVASTIAGIRPPDG